VPEASPGFRVTIDRELCMGSGLCTTYAPSSFTQDAEAKVVLTDPPGDDLEALTTAAEACPMGAIRVDAD
jgi:ferredoxin